MAGTDASGQMGPPAKVEEREKMCSVARGLLTGIDDLLSGRVYQGTGKEEGGAGNNEPSSPRFSKQRHTQEGEGAPTRRHFRRSLEARLELKLSETQVETGVQPLDSPQSSKKDS